MPNLFHREEELDTAQLTTETTGTRSTFYFITTGRRLP